MSKPTPLIRKIELSIPGIRRVHGSSPQVSARKRTDRGCPQAPSLEFGYAAHQGFQLTYILSPRRQKLPLGIQDRSDPDCPAAKASLASRRRVSPDLNATDSQAVGYQELAALVREDDEHDADHSGEADGDHDGDDDQREDDVLPADAAGLAPQSERILQLAEAVGVLSVRPPRFLDGPSCPSGTMKIGESRYRQGRSARPRLRCGIFVKRSQTASSRTVRGSCRWGCSPPRSAPRLSPRSSAHALWRHPAARARALPTFPAGR